MKVKLLGAVCCAAAGLWATSASATSYLFSVNATAAEELGGFFPISPVDLYPGDSAGITVNLAFPLTKADLMGENTGLANGFAEYTAVLARPGGIQISPLTFDYPVYPGTTQLYADTHVTYVYGTLNPGDHYRVTGFEISAGGVPEPTTWTMMILGLFGVGAALRRRGDPSARSRA